MLDKKKIKTELDDLINKGTLIQYVGEWHNNKRAYESNKKAFDLLKQAAASVADFKKDYHEWYAKALRVVSTLAPERHEEFQGYYTGNKIKNSKDFDFFSAGITHFLQGIITTRHGTQQDYYGKFFSGIQQQINIISAISSNLVDALFNLESEIHYGVFQSEIHVAKELLKSKLLRPAGAVAGVIIESHLKLTLERRGVKLQKKNPCMSDYNEALKSNKIIDISIWRLVQRCGDIRNYCVHPKDREPTSDEIEDIIRAAQKIISEVG